MGRLQERSDVVDDFLGLAAEAEGEEVRHQAKWVAAHLLRQADRGAEAVTTLISLQGELDEDAPAEVAARVAELLTEWSAFPSAEGEA